VVLHPGIAASNLSAMEKNPAKIGWCSVSEERSMVREYSMWGLLICLLMSAQSLAMQVDSQQGPCDPNLKQVGQNPQGYRLRGDRCEGIYAQPVSGSSTLLVASFTEAFEDFNPSAEDQLPVDWPSFAKAPIRLRSYALREKLYYQMDTVVAADKTPYLWPTGVLAALHLSKQDIGVVGFTDYQIGGENRRLYVPLRIGRKTQKPGYQVVVVPGSELKAVFISLAPVAADGQPHSFLVSDHELGKGYYPAERGITIELPTLKTPGVYYLEIGATSRYSGPITQQIWFYSRGDE
jgi:hypothetical protein